MSGLWTFFSPQNFIESSRCLPQHITKKSQATHQLACQGNLQRAVKEKHWEGGQEIDGIPLVGEHLVPQCQTPRSIFYDLHKQSYSIKCLSLYWRQVSVLYVPQR